MHDVSFRYSEDSDWLFEHLEFGTCFVCCTIFITPLVVRAGVYQCASYFENLGVRAKRNLRVNLLWSIVVDWSRDRIYVD